MRISPKWVSYPSIVTILGRYTKILEACVAMEKALDLWNVL
jgi:hypothetical protein